MAMDFKKAGLILMSIIAFFSLLLTIVILDFWLFQLIGVLPLLLLPYERTRKIGAAVLIILGIAPPLFYESALLLPGLVLIVAGIYAFSWKNENASATFD